MDAWAHGQAPLRNIRAGDWTKDDLVNHSKTLTDKVMEKPNVMAQIENNSDQQVMHGDFPGAMQEAAMEALSVQSDLSKWLLGDQRAMEAMTLYVLSQIRKDLTSRGAN